VLVKLQNWQPHGRKCWIEAARTAAAALLRSVANELARIVCTVSGSWPSFRRGAILRGGDSYLPGPATSQRADLLM
jgi:hypothetical protein